MNRRSFVKSVLGAGGAMVTSPAFGRDTHLIDTHPILDAHIHLFDPGRPGGVPWPPPDDVVYKPALPARYEQIARPFGVVGAIAIEASPLASDNDWVLRTIEPHPVMVGMIGDLAPSEATFEGELDRLHRNPLFLGIRYGNLWKRNLAIDKERPGFVRGLRSLAQKGLVFESANPDPSLITALLDLAQRLPDLTIVIDHLPNAVEPEEEQGRRTYRAQLEELSRSPRVFVKLSEIAVRRNGQVDLRPETYADRLERIWSIFGEDKVIYGSDWPNSDHVASYGNTLSIVRQFIETKGGKAAHKFFFTNSRRAYRWRPKRANQREGR